MYKTTAVFIALAGLSASADIVRVQEFSSLQFEGFDDLNMRPFDRDGVSAFDGMAEILNMKKNGFIHTTGRWSYGTNGWKGRASAYEGRKMLGTSSGGIEYRFSEDQRSFGGYFATIANTANGEIKFYNGDQLLGSDTLFATVGGDWSWNGWASDLDFNRVTIESNYGNRGGFLMHDSVRVATVEVPTQGTVAAIAGGILLAGRRRR